MVQVFCDSSSVIFHCSKTGFNKAPESVYKHGMYSGMEASVWWRSCNHVLPYSSMLVHAIYCNAIIIYDAWMIWVRITCTNKVQSCNNINSSDCRCITIQVSHHWWWSRQPKLANLLLSCMYMCLGADPRWYDTCGTFTNHQQIAAVQLMEAATKWEEKDNVMVSDVKRIGSVMEEVVKLARYRKCRYKVLTWPPVLNW